MILGDNGTGKEHIAEKIHLQSKRADKPFETVDCGTLSAELAASRLFGHEKGAFTSAEESRKGYFELAEGGTLFLDEIGNLPLDVQAVFALSYAETELAFHQTVSVEEGTNAVGLLVKKALAFIRKMQEHVAAVYHLHGEVATIPVNDAGPVDTKPLVKWTGNAVDLVEMVYGICVMGSVNDGEVKFKELAEAMYKFFGMKAKDCYRFYTDIRRRKNYSRTYFLDKMQEKLNEKMRRDDELERMRR